MHREPGGPDVITFPYEKSMDVQRGNNNALSCVDEKGDSL
jgi:hypothetical protein